MTETKHTSRREGELDNIVRIGRIEKSLDDLSEADDTQFGDDGIRLFDGQRQRVALARALLKDADLLVLDGATSNLDSNLEKETRESIEWMDRDYAMVGIAHRLSTVKNADRIYTVDDGTIVEMGHHEPFINEGRQYAELHFIQHKKVLKY